MGLLLLAKEIGEGKVRFVDVSPKHADGIREYLDAGRLGWPLGNFASFLSFGVPNFNTFS